MNNELSFTFEENNSKFCFSLWKNKKNKLYITTGITIRDVNGYSWKTITYPYYLFVLLEEDDFCPMAKEFCLKYIKNLAFL